VRSVKGKGKGVVYVGARPIPVAKIVFEFNGSLGNNRDEAPDNDDDNDGDDNRYAYLTRGGEQIDGREGGIARFVNHSFWARGINCEMVEFEATPGRLFCRTTREILPGEEMVSVAGSHGTQGQWATGPMGHRATGPQGQREW
jgi:hypothetical protein